MVKALVKVAKWQVGDGGTTRTFLWRKLTYEEPGNKSAITQRIKGGIYLFIVALSTKLVLSIQMMFNLFSLGWLSIKARREERKTVAYLWLIIRAVDRLLSKQTEFTISLDIKA